MSDHLQQLRELADVKQRLKATDVSDERYSLLMEQYRRLGRLDFTAIADELERLEESENKRDPMPRIASRNGWNPLAIGENMTVTFWDDQTRYTITREEFP